MAQLSIAHVCRLPPSESSIALYGSAFRPVLSAGGDVHSVDLADRSGGSQSFRSCARGLRRTRQLAKHSLVHLELSGRALAELWVAAALTLCRRDRPTVVVTCHDLPSIVGASALFTALDRRGLRRLGVLLSDTVGSLVESRVMRHSDVICVLTEAAAAHVRGRYGREAIVLGLALFDQPAQKNARAVFLAGPVSDPERAGAVARVVTAAGSSEWRLIVGLCTPAVAQRVRETSGDRGRVRFTGLLDGRQLLDEFDRALVAVRLGPRRPDNQLAASAPLAWASGSGCVTITDDTRAGACELAEAGRLMQVDDLPAALEELLSRPIDDIEACGRAYGRRSHEQDGVSAVTARYWTGVERGQP